MAEPVPSISKTLFKKLIKGYQAKTLAAQASFKGCVRMCFLSCKKGQTLHEPLNPFCSSSEGYIWLPSDKRQTLTSVCEVNSALSWNEQGSYSITLGQTTMLISWSGILPLKPTIAGYYIITAC